MLKFASSVPRHMSVVAMVKQVIDGPLITTGVPYDVKSVLQKKISPTYFINTKFIK